MASRYLGAHIHTCLECVVGERQEKAIKCEVVVGNREEIHKRRIMSARKQKVGACFRGCVDAEGISVQRSKAPIIERRIADAEIKHTSTKHRETEIETNLALSGLYSASSSSFATS